MSVIMNSRARFGQDARSQRGLSLVELMVGITVGLFVVAAAATLAAGQLGENRRLLLETQVQQDLRATMDIITRQLRRAGAQDVAGVESGLATSVNAGGQKNLLIDVTPESGPASEVDFKFLFDASEQGPYGFKLEGGVVKTYLQRVNATGGAWQELTDSNALLITSFSVTPRNLASVALPCPKLCADGTQACWPTVVVRDFVVEIVGQAKSDSSVKRSLRNEVRLRNDRIRFNDAANPSQLCPA